jgi:glycogen operon protein
MRNLIATVLLSQGVPMIRGGDELGQSQRGNNNVYCQDNELSWLDWTLSPGQRDFLGFVKRVVRIWREHPVLQRRRFFQGRSIRGGNVKDVSWLLPSGAEMGDHDWAGFVRCFGMRLAGDRVDEVDERGRRIEGDTILMTLNAHHETIPFNLPRTLEGQGWEMLVDTGRPSAPMDSNPAQPYPLGARSLAVFRTRRVVAESERVAIPLGPKRDGRFWRLR